MQRALCAIGSKRKETAIIFMRNVFHLSWLETSDAGRPFSADIHFPFERSKKRQNAKSESKLEGTKHLNDLFSGDSWRPSKWSLDQMKLSFCWFTENYEFIGQSSANNVLIYYYPIQCDRCAANVKWVFVFSSFVELWNWWWLRTAYVWRRLKFMWNQENGGRSLT